MGPRNTRPQSSPQGAGHRGNIHGYGKYRSPRARKLGDKVGKNSSTTLHAKMFQLLQSRFTYARDVASECTDIGFVPSDTGISQCIRMGITAQFKFLMWWLFKQDERIRANLYRKNNILFPFTYSHKPSIQSAGC